jgi:hypothetical protein
MNGSRLEMNKKTRRCPTCDSPSPKLHPAVQCGGEVGICRDKWHLPHDPRVIPQPPSGEPATPRKGVYIGAPACFALEEAIRPVCDAFGAYGGSGLVGCYIVGSCLERPDWRDVDVRLMMSDDEFAALFPDAGAQWEHDARWLLLTVAISERLSRLTGLPIDFQFQPNSHANERHNGRRNAIGLRFPSARESQAQRSPIGRPAYCIVAEPACSWPSCSCAPF